MKAKASAAMLINKVSFKYALFHPMHISTIFFNYKLIKSHTIYTRFAAIETMIAPAPAYKKLARSHRRAHVCIIHRYRRADDKPISRRRGTHCRVDAPARTVYISSAPRARERWWFLNCKEVRGSAGAQVPSPTAARERFDEGRIMRARAQEDHDGAVSLSRVAS